ncbi:MAG: hypothetical protein J6W45_01140, partial [Bacteroidales bacterium]|nr:hypothetical protein [Bacteroidales bacterium]
PLQLPNLHKLPHNRNSPSNRNSLYNRHLRNPNLFNHNRLPYSRPLPNRTQSSHSNPLNHNNLCSRHLRNRNPFSRSLCNRLPSGLHSRNNLSLSNLLQ